MSFEAAIQTQRNALLSLVAGWLAVLVLLSAAPVSPAWTLRIRVFLFSVLSRAELAGRYLLLAEAKSSARRLGIACPVSHAVVDPLFANGSNRDEPPSFAELSVRFSALRCLLKNLSRRGVRLLQRMRTDRMADGSLSGANALAALRCLARYSAVDQCLLHAPWHPPRNPLSI